jgi:hypothetical protein
MGDIMETEDQKTLFILAKTMAETRAELDALRTVSIGVINVLAADSENSQALVASIRRCIEADTATSLASSMDDHMLKMRSDWYERQLPPHIWAAVKNS